MTARWPKVGSINPTLINEAMYITEIVHELRVRIKKLMAKVCPKNAEIPNLSCFFSPKLFFFELRK